MILIEWAFSFFFLSDAHKNSLFLLPSLDIVWESLTIRQNMKKRVVDFKQFKLTQTEAEQRDVDARSMMIKVA